MKKKTVLKIVFLSATALLLAFIFIMSAETAEESSELSVSLGYRLCEIFKPGFKTLPEEEKMQIAEGLDHFVRKTAHFAEFAALGALLYADFALFDFKGLKCILPAFLSGCAAAALDELHQTFVPGRAGMATDILLDCSGVLTGCLFSLLVFYIIRLIKAKKQNPSPTK